MPKKEFITSRLLNWTLSDPTTRIVIPVGLEYGGDVTKALALMLEAAREHPDVLADPEPSVIFDGFGDNALSLKLRCFVPTMENRILYSGRCTRRSTGSSKTPGWLSPFRSVMYT